MLVSIEIPVTRGDWLLACVRAVLRQSSDRWRLSLLDCGQDAAATAVLRALDRLRHPALRVLDAPGLHLAAARQRLTEASEADLILPLDDGCVLVPQAVATFLEVARTRPWAGLLHARRVLFDPGVPPGSDARPAADPIAFGPRRYLHGMTVDPDNSAKPYALLRWAWRRTAGWRTPGGLGGEDADMFLQVEEVAEIEAVDRPLCLQRGSPGADASRLDPAAWCRAMDAAIRRRGSAVTRVGEAPPFRFRRRRRRRAPDLAAIDCVVPFWSQDLEELPYSPCRLATTGGLRLVELSRGACYLQAVDAAGCHRVELACAVPRRAAGRLRAAWLAAPQDGGQPLATCEVPVRSGPSRLRSIALEFAVGAPRGPLWLELRFQPETTDDDTLALYGAQPEAGGPEDRRLVMRLFSRHPGAGRRRLQRCLDSLLAAGIDPAAVHVVERRQSSAANKNEGVARSGRPLVCFVDDDVEIRGEGVFERLLGELESGAGLAGPKIVGPDGAIFCAAPYFTPHRTPRPRGLGEPDHGQYEFTAEVPWLPSTFLLVRRGVCRATGGFYEGFAGTQMEDVDFSLRARRKGFTCRYVGDVSIVHWNLQRNDRCAENLELFRARWRSHPELLS